MIGAVWKLIIFTGMVKRLINTSRNERVTLQVYDTCLQMFDFFGLQKKDCHTCSALSSETEEEGGKKENCCEDKWYWICEIFHI
jgi:hypothetical protein